MTCSAAACNLILSHRLSKHIDATHSTTATENRRGKNKGRRGKASVSVEHNECVMSDECPAASPLSCRLHLSPLVRRRCEWRLSTRYRSLTDKRRRRLALSLPFHLLPFSRLLLSCRCLVSMERESDSTRFDTFISISGLRDERIDTHSNQEGHE